MEESVNGGDKGAVIRVEVAAVGIDGCHHTLVGRVDVAVAIEHEVGVGGHGMQFGAGAERGLPGLRQQ